MTNDRTPSRNATGNRKDSLGDGWTQRTVGSGISNTEKIGKTVALADLSPDHLSLLSAPAWSENQTMIASLFGEIYQRSQMCPGRDMHQCCGAADEDAYCTPNWREREDPEWYAQEINKYLSVVNLRTVAGSTHDRRSIADNAFELGCLLTEALIKFQWDRHAKRGLLTLDSAAKGGRARRDANSGRCAAEETVTAVDELLATGMPVMAAYQVVAKAQRVGAQTIGKEYRRQKK